MMQAQIRGSGKPTKSVVFGVATLIAGAMVFAAPNSVQAKPEHAAKTGLPCVQCHTNAAGGGKLKPFGEAFRANGYQVPKKK